MVQVLAESSAAILCACIMASAIAHHRLRDNEVLIGTEK